MIEERREATNGMVMVMVMVSDGDGDGLLGGDGRERIGWAHHHSSIMSDVSLHISVVDEVGDNTFQLIHVHIRAVQF